MGTFSIWHWLIVLVVVLVLFGGGGKLSRLMGDFGKGLKSFKKNIKDIKKSDTEINDPRTIDAKATEVGTSETSSEKANANKD
jgi:sec-independent protein translocase protein TatA